MVHLLRSSASTDIHIPYGSDVTEHCLKQGRATAQYDEGHTKGLSLLLGFYWLERSIALKYWSIRKAAGLAL